MKLRLDHFWGQRLAIAVLTAGAFACVPGESPENPAHIAELKKTYEGLHKRLEAAAAQDPQIASAFAAKGQVLIAIRSGLIEELAGNIAQRYLDQVTVDLRDVKGHGSGELKKQTFLGKIKVGNWDVRIALGDLVGDLSAGTPQVGLRQPNLIDIDLPVDVHETEGSATLHFSWDSAGIAGVVCKDFELTREIRGRVLNQQHSLTGALRLDNTGDSLTATPIFPNRKVKLKLDLTKKSWAVVEAALQSQNTSGTCGMLMKPAVVLRFLRDLAGHGIDVPLPDSIFRVVRLPARVHESVKVNGQTIALDLKAESLRVETATLWSGASVTVKAR
ncbi:MAG: hypothetical protein ABI672_00745 [Vicinamibacteria bacterium]